MDRNGVSEVTVFSCTDLTKSLPLSASDMLPVSQAAEAARSVIDIHAEQHF